MTTDSGTAESVVIVTGSVLARPETLDQMRTLSLDHVHRSRQERGCLAHNVHQDVEEPLRLVFFERWADIDALRDHFAVPASGAFVAALAALAAEPPSMSIYQATRARP